MALPRIALMVNEWQTSGGTRNLAEIGNGLKKRGYPVIALSGGNNFDYHLDFYSTNKEKDIEWFKPDIILASFYSTVVWALKLYNTIKPKMVGYIVQHDESLTYGEHVKMSYDWDWDFFLTISPWLKRFLEGYGHKNVGLFTPAIDHTIFKPYNNKKPNTVCFYSREMKRKRTDVGLKALRIIKKKMPEAEIHTYDLFPKPKNIDSIHHLHPKHEEMARLLSMCAVHMASTPKEGFGTMSLEPMACGTAVVTPDIEGTEQFPAGTIMYAKVDDEDIADRVIHLLNNDRDRERRIKKGLEFAKTITWDHMLDQVEEFIGKQWEKQSTS